jgi:hypothetical protein
MIGNDDGMQKVILKGLMGNLARGMGNMHTNKCLRVYSQKFKVSQTKCAL